MKKSLRLLVAGAFALLCGSVYADTETITFADLGYANAEEISTVNGTNITLTFSVGTGSTTPKYYDTGAAARLYGGGTLTISSTYTITEIAFTFSSSSYAPTSDNSSFDSGEFDYGTYKWTGSATSVVLTNTASSGHFRIQAVTVTFTGDGTTKKSAGLAWSESSISVEQGSDFTAPTFTKETTADVTFTSDNETVATVTSEGVISITGELGTAVITASSEANDDYYAGTATCTVKVYTYKTYTKATTVEAGKEYLIVVQDDDVTRYAYPLSSSSSYGYLYTYYVSGLVDEISVSTLYNDGFIIDTQDDGYSIVDVETSRYYYQSGTYKSFQLATSAPEAVWYITLQDDGTFKLECNGYYVQYSTSYSSFGIYTDEQGLMPYLYVLTEEEEEETDEGEVWSLCGDVTGDDWSTFLDFEYQGDGVYTLELETMSGGFKINKDHAWDVQYGSNGSTVDVGTTYTLKSNGDNLSFTNSATLTNATLTLTVTDDAVTLLAEAESYTEITENEYYLIGDFDSWSFTDKFESTDTEGVYTIDVDAISGTFKIALNGAWVSSYGSNGSKMTINEEYELNYGSSPGNITLDDSYENVTFTLTIGDDDEGTLLMQYQETTGINAISSATLDAAAPIYNIAGQRVTADAKGVLIQNGKKFVNK